MINKKYIFKVLSLTLASISLAGCTEYTPFIGENNHWYIKEVDNGVNATGDKGNKGDNGDKGSSVSLVSITLKEETDTSIIYLMTFSDGYSSTFTVNKGEDLKVNEFVKVDTIGDINKYQIIYSDGTTGEFEIKDGSSVEIGFNYNWFINGVDTGIYAGFAGENSKKLTLKEQIVQDHLEYEFKYINGVFGYEVTGLYLNEYDFSDSNYKLQSTKDDFERVKNEIFSSNPSYNIIIPDYYANYPVIGIANYAFATNNAVKEITLSKNTMYIGNSAFREINDNIKMNFNNAQILSVGDYAFYKDDLIGSTFPSSIIFYGKSCFEEAKLEQFNFNNAEAIMEKAFLGYQYEAHLPKTIQYLGSNAFGDAQIIFD